MNQRKKFSILITLSFFILLLLYNSNKNKIKLDEIDVKRTTFYYIPNDTHCPTANFDEPYTEYNSETEVCKHETGDWIIVRDNFALFNISIIEIYGDIQCVYKDIKWQTDFKSIIPQSWNRFFNNTFLGNDILLVKCKGKSLFQYYEQYLFGFQSKIEIDYKNTLNDILIVGIDSVSRQAWKRLLKESHSYLEHNMSDSSVIFEKMNVLGDGTTVNVMGILAGEFELDAYESRRGYPGAKTVDDYPWIWKLLKEYNYTSYYDEDDVAFGTFQYRLLGFRSKPTDFYSRTWRIIQQLKKRSTLCVNYRNIFQDQLHNLRSFYKNIKSHKFAFVWSTYFSHDVNEKVIQLDKSILGLLKEVNDPNGIFNNTIFLLMSDHGHRFNSRLHLQGKFEERLPFFSIHLPKTLTTKQPALYENLKINKNKLITTMDAYESLRDIVSNFTIRNTHQPAVHKLTLFDNDVPLRQCHEIKIAPHWCSCLKWTEVSKDKQVVRDAAQFLVNIINNSTDEYRSKCHLLQLDNILRAHSLSPPTEVIKFHDSDRHGRKPHLSDNTVVNGINYRISIKTKPGDALFESTVSSRNINGKMHFSVDFQNVDRSNRYQNWIWCITSDMRDVRKYCLCS